MFQKKVISGSHIREIADKKTAYNEGLLYSSKFVDFLHFVIEVGKQITKIPKTRIFPCLLLFIWGLALKLRLKLNYKWCSEKVLSQVSLFTVLWCRAVARKFWASGRHGIAAPIPVPKIKLFDADYCMQSKFLFWFVRGAPFSTLSCVLIENKEY